MICCAGKLQPEIDSQMHSLKHVRNPAGCVWLTSNPKVWKAEVAKSGKLECKVEAYL